MTGETIASIRSTPGTIHGDPDLLEPFVDGFKNNVGSAFDQQLLRSRF